MRPMRVLPALVVVVLSPLLVAGDAEASSGDVIDDCTKHGTLTKRYSQRDYRQALSQLPADVDEYGNCRDVIHNAQVAGAGNRGGGGAGGGGPAGFRAPGPDVTTASGTGGRSSPVMSAAAARATTPRRSTRQTPATTTPTTPTRTAR
jgi:hypothetical protein